MTLIEMLPMNERAHKQHNSKLKREINTRSWEVATISLWQGHPKSLHGKELDQSCFVTVAT